MKIKAKDEFCYCGYCKHRAADGLCYGVPTPAGAEYVGMFEMACDKYERAVCADCARHAGHCFEERARILHGGEAVNGQGGALCCRSYVRAAERTGV